MCHNSILVTKTTPIGLKVEKQIGRIIAIQGIPHSMGFQLAETIKIVQVIANIDIRNMAKSIAE